MSLTWINRDNLLLDMHQLEEDMERDYYVSDDWSIEFYVLQATRGFIAVSAQNYLLPQLQRSYCLLEFQNLAIPKRIAKTLDQYTLSFNTSFPDVIQAIHAYHEEKSWLSPQYQDLCERMHVKGAIILTLDKVNYRFQLVSIALFQNTTHELVAGEIGYTIGKTYTSLTGFCMREKKISIGKIQILKLAKFLECNGYHFMNLGQPPMGEVMEYKAELGGIEVSRSDFLKKWNVSTCS